MIKIDRDIKQLRSYFETTGDRISKIWLICEKEAIFLKKHTIVDKGDFRIAIIDQNSGKQPIILNYDFLVNGNGTVACGPVVILDSNVVSYLHMYRVNQGGFRETNAGATIRELVSIFINMKCDYNPIFYSLETYAKSTSARFNIHASELMESILQFHTMDEDAFLVNGQIIPCQSAVESYKARYGSSNMKYIAEQTIKNFSKTFGLSEPNLLQKIIYAALLKMALINKSKKHPHEKLDEFIVFCLEDLGGHLQREVIIAAYYFSGRYAKFIPLEKSSNWEKTKIKFLASAWDVFLLRLPEYILSLGDQNLTSICYICTGDKLLQDIGQQVTLSWVKAWLPRPYQITVGYKVNLNQMRQDLGRDLAMRFCEDGSIVNHFLIDKKRHAPLNEQEQLALVRRMEDEVTQFFT